MITRNIYRAGRAVYRNLPEPIQEYIWTKTRASGLEDRRYLEQVVVPALCATRPRRVLFVGTRLYTRHYGKWFESAGAEYWTLEIMPQLARYGSKNHVVGSVVESDRLFEANFFDVVILNGVFAWGVDRVEDQEATLDGLWKALTPDGILVLGYNVDRVKNPREFESIRARYTHGGVPGLPEHIGFRTASHVYDFFRARKP